MPIVISRETGSIQASSPCTPDQIDLAWEAIAQAWAAANTERLHALADEYASEPRGT